jgi:hypothetical protein
MNLLDPLTDKVFEHQIEQAFVAVVTLQTIGLQSGSILGVRVPAIIAVGDAVILSVERGEDLGFVTRVMTMGEFLMERFQSAFLPQKFNINR